ncbi:hypothetical protein PTSG_13111 [Salpingoeca rosetta]|uniref:HTH CENPB-type domain-containing protein n=1 Tax=Salpingoeca rosetta (strain ATCC 50818 / BSB-021) TaxID=946362 RepID=F2UR90_SALR5|nr:uncharacterized protein PTSG_13111 [Salpingoeca rosetta]EGD80193.1 hypothetical protein PTSG_13111 [Salpingoeca rosetta]|eukprot:XP_004988255.1 hypothetical protein PTSG_13111 [Salpingoeca rosetta]
MTKMKTRMEKYNIAMEAIAGHTKQKHVAEKHGVTAATLSKWVKKVKAGELRGDERDASCKKARPLQFGEIEDRLVQYIKLRERKYLVDGLGLSWKLVQEKALKFAADMKATHPDKAATLDNFRASPGWFQGVRKRHNIKSVRLHGEAGSVDEETAATAMAEFKQAVSATSITNPQFVFNADETGLFYQTLPSRLYVSRSERSVRGVKQMAAKARLTIMTATSAAGEKVPLFSVGKSRRPMCLRDDFPPVRYTSQASAWFDTDMANYYVRFFLKWKRSRYGDEPVVLIWDNCPAHKNVTNPAPKELHLLFLPPNLTSKHQPMDMGLISAVKMRYKAYVLQQLLAYYDDGQQTPLPKSRGLRGLAHGAPPNIRDALTILKRVWEEVKPESVVRCWMKAACLPESLFPQQHTQQQQRVTSDEMLTERSSEEEGQEGEGGQLVQNGLGAENEQYDEAEQRMTESRSD